MLVYVSAWREQPAIKVAPEIDRLVISALFNSLLPNGVIIDGRGARAGVILNTPPRLVPESSAKKKPVKGE